MELTELLWAVDPLHDEVIHVHLLPEYKDSRVIVDWDVRRGHSDRVRVAVHEGVDNLPELLEVDHGGRGGPEAIWGVDTEAGVRYKSPGDTFSRSFIHKGDAGMDAMKGHVEAVPHTVEAVDETFHEGTESVDVGDEVVEIRIHRAVDGELQDVLDGGGEVIDAVSGAVGVSADGREDVIPAAFLGSLFPLEGVPPLLERTDTRLKIGQASIEGSVVRYVGVGSEGACGCVGRPGSLSALSGSISLRVSSRRGGV